MIDSSAPIAFAYYSVTDESDCAISACQGTGKDDISVWSGNGTGICYFGEMIAIGMMGRGSVGSLVDGGVRDVRWLRELEFPDFARYRAPVQSIGRWRVTS